MFYAFLHFSNKNSFAFSMYWMSNVCWTCVRMFEFFFASIHEYSPFFECVFTQSLSLLLSSVHTFWIFEVFILKKRFGIWNTQIYMEKQNKFVASFWIRTSVLVSQNVKKTWFLKAKIVTVHLVLREQYILVFGIFLNPVLTYVCAFACLLSKWEVRMRIWFCIYTYTLYV